MPELPEVETVRRGLETYVVGQTISTITVHNTKVIHHETKQLEKKQIRHARRKSKLLILDVDGGYSIAIHLKMTGRLIFEDPQYPEHKKDWEFDYATNKHTHVVLTFQNGSRLYFNDYRRFGTVDIIPTSEIETLSYIKNLGKEFFVNLSSQDFIQILSKSSRAIKTLLLDQTKIAGVGNIYANEALWLSHIHPETPSRAISVSQGRALYAALEERMKEALTLGGASSDNFRDLFGSIGHAQDNFLVYNKEKTPCRRCGTLLEKYFVGGRGTYICRTCQNND